MSDFWPDDLANNTMKPPIAILKEAGADLMNKTNHVLSCVVDTSPELGQFGIETGKLVHTLKIVAPAIGNYTYEVLKVTHDITLYPLEVEADKTYLCREESTFLAVLRTLFRSDHIRKVIASLLSQSQSA